MTTPSQDSTEKPWYRRRCDDILQNMGVAIYENFESGEFIDPNDSLAEFFLGQGAKGKQLADRRFQEFYVFLPQRDAFLKRLKDHPGQVVTTVLLLKSQQSGNPEQIWCRCRSRWQPQLDGTPARCQGIITRLAVNEEWIPGNLLAETGWAYFRMNEQGDVVYASQKHAELLGRKGTDGHHEPTPWYNQEERNQFMQQLREKKTHSAKVSFKKSGEMIRAECFARFLEQEGMEAIWRDLTEEEIHKEATTDAANLHTRQDSLSQFEQSLVDTVAKQCWLHTAAFFRHHDNDTYLLRAVSGLSPDLDLIREYAFAFVPGDSHREITPSQTLLRFFSELHLANPDITLTDECPGDPSRERERLLRQDAVKQFVADKTSETQRAHVAYPVEQQTERKIKEFLIPIYYPAVEVEKHDDSLLTVAESVYGFLWIPLWLYDKESWHGLEAWLEAFTSQCGLMAQNIEEELAKRTSRQFLEWSIKIMLEQDIDSFYKTFLNTFVQETQAEVGTLFVLEEKGINTKILRFKTTTSKVFWDTETFTEIPKTLWGDIIRPEGHGLMWQMIDKKQTVSLLNSLQERKERGLSLPKHMENISLHFNHPTSWLGCPILHYQVAKSVIAYARLLNRKVHGGSAGFSKGDIKLADELSRVATQVLHLQTQYKELQNAIIGSLHELRAPLIGIRGSAERLRKKLASPNTLEYIKFGNILADTDMFFYLLETIAMSQREFSPRSAWMLLYRDVIAPLCSNTPSHSPEKRLQIDRRNMQHCPPVYADRNMLKQVFYNLLSNAIHYHRPDKKEIRVEMEWSLRQDVLEIAFRDYGMGIDGDQAADTIFERGFRTPKAKNRRPSGSGLGLYISRRIMELHGGSLVLSQARNPTTFTLILPLPPREEVVHRATKTEGKS